MTVEQKLTRTKDVLTIVISALSILVIFFAFYMKPIALEYRIKTCEDKDAKYIPIIEAADKNLEVVRVHYEEILRRLAAIEKALEKK